MCPLCLQITIAAWLSRHAACINMRPAKHFNKVKGFVGQNSQNREPLYNAIYRYVILTLHSFVHMINKWLHTTAHKRKRSGVAVAMIVQINICLLAWCHIHWYIYLPTFTRSQGSSRVSGTEKMGLIYRKLEYAVGVEAQW
jgi:hypothetical protein